MSTCNLLAIGLTIHSNLLAAVQVSRRVRHMSHPRSTGFDLCLRFLTLPPLPRTCKTTTRLYVVYRSFQTGQAFSLSNFPMLRARIA